MLFISNASMSYRISYLWSDLGRKLHIDIAIYAHYDVNIHESSEVMVHFLKKSDKYFSIANFIVR